MHSSCQQPLWAPGPGARFTLKRHACASRVEGSALTTLVQGHVRSAQQPQPQPLHRRMRHFRPLLTMQRNHDPPPPPPPSGPQGKTLHTAGREDPSTPTCLQTFDLSPVPWALDPGQMPLRARRSTRSWSRRAPSAMSCWPCTASASSTARPDCAAPSAASRTQPLTPKPPNPETWTLCLCSHLRGLLWRSCSPACCRQLDACKPAPDPALRRVR